MRLRKISGKSSDLEIFKTWLIKKYSSFEELSPFIFKTSYGCYQYLGDSCSIPELIPDALKSLKISKTSYYKFSVFKDKVFFFFHAEGSTFPMGSNSYACSLSYCVSEASLNISTQYYILGQELITTGHINAKKRFLLQQINQKLIKDNFKISDYIDKLPFQAITKEKLAKQILPVNNRVNYKALSSFFIIIDTFNLDLFNQLQSKPTLIYHCNLNANAVVSKNKKFNWLKKLPFLMKNCLLLKDTSDQLQLNPEIIPEIMKTRVRNFHHLSTLTNALIKEMSILQDNSLADRFAKHQAKMKLKQNKNFIIPQTVFELRDEAKKMRNCAISYAQVVLNTDTFIGFYYLNEKMYCLTFDRFLNVIELAGFKNEKISSLEYDYIAKSLQS